MKIRLLKDDYNQLSAASAEDFEKIKKLKRDVFYEIDIKKARNYEFHKKFFALMKVGLDNTKSGIIDLTLYRSYIMMKAGHCIIFDTSDGKVAIADRITFDKMDEFEFEQVYNDCFNQILIDIEADEELFRKELVLF